MLHLGTLKQYVLVYSMCVRLPGRQRLHIIISYHTEKD